ncbi:MAG: hypothetical protein GX258_08435 [Clostridiales bacterium]|nr:hypothetical protein [Clostridiales bacterium]
MMKYNFHTRDDKQNILLVLLSAILFYINEGIKFKVDIPYLGYLLRNHYNDFLGGISFMALLNLILLFSKYNKIKKLKLILLVALGCSIFWEVITPIFLVTSTGDFYDFIAYTLGFTLYWIIKRFKNKDMTYSL